VKEIETEVLVIGSEGAGAKASIEAQEEGAEVLVVTKGLSGRSGSTVMAGGRIQAPLGEADPRDNANIFFEDVIKGGDYLNNQNLVDRMVKLAVTEVPKLELWGAKFMKKDGKFEQVQHPDSSYPRSLRLAGVHGGLQYRVAMNAQYRRLNTKILEDLFVTSLLTSSDQVAGAFGISLRDGQFVVVKAKNVILATGGSSEIYRKTDASHDATGDGMVLAYNAGADLMDMEFHQFLPFCCYEPLFEMSGLTTRLRYCLHGKLYNRIGEAFMERYLPSYGDWGPRNATSRAIYLEHMYGRGSPRGGAYLSFSHLPENLINDYIEREKPGFIDDLKKAGIEIQRRALECGPAAHYSMGGIRVNEYCATSLPRLYACGEVAAGMDGAERIDGGTALTWCLTMGYIAGKEAAKMAKELDWLSIDNKQVSEEERRVSSLLERREGIKAFEIKNKLKDIMWNYCSLVKDRGGLETALGLIQKIRSEDLPLLCVPSSSKTFNRGWTEALEVVNMIELSEMAIRASLMREESRGAHYRSDFPRRDNPKWLKNIIIKKEEVGMTFSTAAPVLTRLRPLERD